MAHSAIWGYRAIQRQNTNSKKLMIENVCESHLKRHTKFGADHLNHEEKIRHLPILNLTRDLIGFNMGNNIS